MKYVRLGPDLDIDFDIIVADEFEDDEAPTEPRPLLTEAWAKSMNHVNDIRRRDLRKLGDVCAPSRGRCSGG